jgi:hypothetical protein
MTEYLAIEIDTPKAFEVVKALDPIYKDLPYDDAHQCFMVLDFPSIGQHTLLRPDHLDGFTLIPGVKIKTLAIKKD